MTDQRQIGRWCRAEQVDIFAKTTIYIRSLYIYEGSFLLYIASYKRVRSRAFLFFNLFLIDTGTPSCYYIIVPGGQEKKLNVCAVRSEIGDRQEGDLS